MERHGIDEHQAFAMLNVESRRTNRKNASRRGARVERATAGCEWPA